MIKMQVQLPDDLYYTAKAIAEQRGWTLAEVICRGIEYMALAYPVRPTNKSWVIPVLKKGDFNPQFDQLDLKALAESAEIGGMGMRHQNLSIVKHQLSIRTLQHR